MTGSAWSWERIDVSAWRQLDEEQSSTKEAQWRIDESVEPARRWLFKPVRRDEKDRAGWDWVEFVSMIVADCFGTPCARTRLAYDGACGAEGSISHDVLKDGDGRVWIARQTGVCIGKSAGARSDDSNHTPERIRASLEGVEAPSRELREAGLGGFNAFAGDTCLDALIANQDRHGQNWAVISPSRGGPARSQLRPRKRTRCPFE